jgi:hypothetical protein
MATRKKYAGQAEVIIRILFGSPPSLKSFPLPPRLIKFLVHCDQEFHERLLKGKKTKGYTTEQIRSARIALQKQLLVTRMLYPMVVQLANKKPGFTEIAFLGVILKEMINAVNALSKEIFVKSFATWPEPLQKVANEKLNKEKIEERKKGLKSKPSVRHTRSKSADTTLLDIRQLPASPREAHERRTRQKALEIASGIEADADQLSTKLTEARKTVIEKIEYEQGLESVKNLSAEELDLLLNIIRDRDDDELANAVASGVIIQGRARPLSFDGNSEQPGEDYGSTQVTETSTTNSTTTTTSTRPSSSAPLPKTSDIARDSSGDDNSNQTSSENE